MHRNLDRRVEALVRVTDPAACAHLARVITLSMSEDTRAFELRGDGTWHRREVGPDEPPPVDVQEALLRRVIHRSD
jgi:polyphosphate kinase